VGFCFWAEAALLRNGSWAALDGRQAGQQADREKMEVICVYIYIYILNSISKTVLIHLKILDQTSHCNK
jgi:hypothetical protein